MIKLSDDIYKQIMWDYDIPKEDVEKLLSGESERAGHYTINSMFVKMLQALTWYSLLGVLGKAKIMELLTHENIKKLRFKSLQEQYTYVRARLFELV